MPKNIGKISLEEIAKVFEILNKGRKDNLLSPVSIARYINIKDYGILEAKQIKGKYFILNPNEKNKTIINENTGRVLIVDDSGLFYEDKFSKGKLKKEMPLNYEEALEYLILQGYEFFYK